VKESDRLAAIVAGLTALGCDARIGDDACGGCGEADEADVRDARGENGANDKGDNLYVSFAPPHRDAPRLETHGDHRLAMTWAIAARAFDLAPDIHGLESVKVSYPAFFDDLKRLS
jgi:3-phosphoshikimate 1-carboxyvinyltransferase